MKMELGGHYLLSSQMFFIIDESLQFVSVNPSFEKKMGWKAADLIEKKFTDFIAAEDLEKVLSTLDQKVEQEIFLNLHFLNSAKQYFALLFRFVWSLDKGCYYGFVKDPAKSSHFDVIFRSMSEGVVVQDAFSRVIHFNQASLDILGLSADQLIGKSSHDPQWKVMNENYESITSDAHPAVIALRTGKLQKNTIMGVHNQQGQVRWLNVTAVPVFLDNEAEPYQIIVTFNDITIQFEAKKNIENKEREISNLMNMIPSMIGRWDANLINTHANTVYSNYFNKQPHEIKGKHISELIGENLYQQNKSYLEKCLQGEAQTFEREIPLPDGKSYRSTISSYVPDVLDGKVIGILVVVTDVTELKRLEKAQRYLELKLISGSRLASLGEMAAGIAHEINNPLAIIRSKAELLDDKIKKGETDLEVLTKGFSKIISTIDRIANVINGLRSFSRDGEKDPFVKSSISFLINETLEFCQERFEKNDVELKLNIENDLDINCRPVQISQVLMNLLLNSFDAISDQSGKWIRIDLRLAGDLAIVEITDSGLGIPEEIVEKIMQPFFTTKGVGKGTGLGLSISRGIIVSHHGALEYVPESENTCFRISLPIYKTINN
jgi:PAS domain S-box-containing protein